MNRILLIFGLLLFGFTPAQKARKDYSKIMTSKSIYEIDAFLRDAHPDDPRRSVLKPRLMNMIKNYIKEAHPADSRVKELQEKLVMLQTRSSTKITFDEMNAKIREKQIAEYKKELARINSGYYAAKQRVNTKDLLNDAEPAADADRPVKPGKSIFDITPRSSSGTAAKSAPAVSTAMADAEKAEFDLLMNPSVLDHKNKTVKILNALFDNDPNSKETTVMIRNNSDCDMIMRMEGVGTTKYRLAIPARKENTIVLPKGDYVFSSQVCGAQYISQKTVTKAIMVSLGSPAQ